MVHGEELPAAPSLKGSASTKVWLIDLSEAAAGRIAHLGQAKKWPEALHVLKGLTEVDVGLLGALLTALERGSAWAAALQLLDDCARRRWALDGWAYGAAAAACERKHQRRASERLLSQLWSKTKTEADVLLAFNGALRGAASTRRGDALLARFVAQSGCPDIVSYNTLMSSCEREQQWTKALWHLAVLRRRALQPTVVTFSTAINACAKGAQWPRALGLMMGLQSQEIQPNAVTIASCMDACTRGRQWLLAFHLMERSNATNTAVLHVFLHSMAAGSAWEQVLQTFATFEGYRNAEAFCAVLVACASSTQWRHALHHWKEMGCEVYVGRPAWHAVQSCLASAARWQEALQLLWTMQVPPDVVNHLTVARACIQGGHPDEVFGLLPPLRGRALLTLLCREGQCDLELSTTLDD
ncbi:unnamed protein product [Durusdinium trenchii]|uniref:Pentatricopeptide repeat-containing protein, chloroplastic n=1 Tax=Durusdinium trenchii TaxID=1381693 RepID=A0ABP0M541_9DINO